MPEPSIEARIANLFEHEVMADAFTDADRRTLDAVLDELHQYGQPVLAAHDRDGQAGATQPEWVCSLNWRTREQELVSAAAETPLLAALYCLMEAAYYTRRQLRSSLPELDV